MVDHIYGIPALFLVLAPTILGTCAICIECKDSNLVIVFSPPVMKYNLLAVAHLAGNRDQAKAASAESAFDLICQIHQHYLIPTTTLRNLPPLPHHLGIKPTFLQDLPPPPIHS